MGIHINEKGQFQSDKYPMCPPCMSRSRLCRNFAATSIRETRHWRSLLSTDWTDIPSRRRAGMMSTVVTMPLPLMMLLP